MPSSRLDARSGALCIDRLRDFIEPLGLVAIRSNSGVVVAHPDITRPLNARLRGTVIGWLVAQPSFVIVTTVRRPVIASPREAIHG